MVRAAERRGPRDSTRADSVANRESILDAAERLFSTTADATMTDVAAEAGVTRATVYRHFPARDDLVDALVGRLAGPASLGFIHDIRGERLPEAMARLAQSAVDLAQQHGILLRMIAPRLEEMARLALDDEPLTAELRRRRATGELDVPMSDAWIAACVRALCIAAVSDERPPEEVVPDLAHSLQRLVTR